MLIKPEMIWLYFLWQNEAFKLSTRAKSGTNGDNFDLQIWLHLDRAYFP